MHTTYPIPNKNFRQRQLLSSPIKYREEEHKENLLDNPQQCDNRSDIKVEENNPLHDNRKLFSNLLMKKIEKLDNTERESILKCLDAVYANIKNIREKHCKFYRGKNPTKTITPYYSILRPVVKTEFNHPKEIIT